MQRNLMRGELQLQSFPPLIPELQGEGDTQTDTGETGSGHAATYRRAAVLGTQIKQEPPPRPPVHRHTHTHDRHRKMRKRSCQCVNEHVCLYLQGCVNLCSTTPSCRLPSVWASALHNSLFLCVLGWPHVCELFIASLHTLGMIANGEALLFITHLGHTKIFLFPLVAGFTVFFSSSSSSPVVYFITSREIKYHFGSVHIMFDQLMFGFVHVLVKYVYAFFFGILFTFQFTSLFYYVMKCTEETIQCALYPIMHRTQQQQLCDPELIILFDLVLTSNLALPHSATLYQPAEGFTLHSLFFFLFSLALFTKEVK